MRSNRYSFATHQYPTSSYPSTQSSSSSAAASATAASAATVAAASLSPYANRSTVTNATKTNSSLYDGTRRFSSSTSTTQRYPFVDQTYNAYDSSQLLANASRQQQSTANNRSTTTGRRSLSLTLALNERRKSDVNSANTRSTQRQSDGDNNVMMNGTVASQSQWLLNRRKRSTEMTNESNNRNMAYNLNNGGISSNNGLIAPKMLDIKDADYQSTYQRRSSTEDSTVVSSSNRHLTTTSENRAQAAATAATTLRRQSLTTTSDVGGETFLTNNKTANSQRMESLQRAYSAPSSDPIEQQIFLRRLLKAHNVVDDMLRSRGLSPDDERNYLRYLAKLPELREEEKLANQTETERCSSEETADSDSGLSLDNDSEESAHGKYTECVIQPPEELIAINCTFVNTNAHHDQVELIIRSQKILNKSSSNHLFVKLQKTKPKRHSTKKLSSMNSLSKYNENQQNSAQFERKQQQLAIVANRTLDALFYGRRKVRSSAEISIQHVSFYQIAQSLAEQQAKPIERVVRIHFRLTQRHHQTLGTFIRLPQPIRPVHVLFNVKAAAATKQQRFKKTRSKTIELAQLEQQQQTPMSPTLMLRKTIPANIRKNMTTTNRVHIPDSFLKPLNRTTSETTSTNKQQNSDSDEPLRLARHKLKHVAFNQTIRTKAAAITTALPTNFMTTTNQNTQYLDVASQDGLPKSPETISGKEAKINVVRNSLSKISNETEAKRLAEVKSKILPHTQNTMKISNTITSMISNEKSAKISEDMLLLNEDNNGMQKLPKDDTKKHSFPSQQFQKPPLRRALTSINDKDVHNAIRQQQQQEQQQQQQQQHHSSFDGTTTDRTLIEEFRRTKTIPAPQAVIRIEVPAISIGDAQSRILNVKPVRDFVEPLPPAKFLKQRTPERFIRINDTIQTNCSSSKHLETNEIILKPINRIRKPIISKLPNNSTTTTTTATANDGDCLKVTNCTPPQTGNGGESPFGVRLKRVDRKAIKTNCRGAITLVTAKKPWIPKWRRVERCEEENGVEEDEQTEESVEPRKGYNHNNTHNNNNSNNNNNNSNNKSTFKTGK